jgi:putative ABC transport system permease protein
MNLATLAIRNIANKSVRSAVVLMCAALVSGLALATEMLSRGMEKSLELVKDRLGADIMVIPAGNQTVVEQALLMCAPVDVWMPRDVVSRLEDVPGVELATPQLFLSTMRGASCCSVSDMFMVAYDPATDFTVKPWLKQNMARDLQLGEAIGGHYIKIPEDRENILIYGYEIELMGNLERTGSNLDQSMFFTYETALEIARLSPMRAERELVINPESISAALVRLSDDAEPARVGAAIEQTIAGVVAIENANLFRNQRERLERLTGSLATLNVIAWLVAIGLVGLITSTALSARHQEIGILQALGASRTKVILLIEMEGIGLALWGGVMGLAFTAYAIFLFRNLISSLAQIPVYYPEVDQLLMQCLVILALVTASIALTALLPTLRTAYQEASTAMKEK